MDVANLLGLSSSLLYLSERREKADRWIVGIGILVSLIVLFLLYYFLVRA